MPYSCLKPGEYVINDQNYIQTALGPGAIVDGEQKEFGMIPRDYGAEPYGSLVYAPAYDMELIPEDEIDDRIEDQEKNGTSLEHLRERYKIRSLDQDGYGYCWNFSGTKAVMFVLADMNEVNSDGAVEELSGWAGAAIIKNYRNQGGWCQQGLKLGTTMGYPSLKAWPQKGVDPRYDTPEMRADAATRRVTEWMDLEQRNKRQLASNLLRNIPTMIDLNWWGHSVCAFRLVSWNPFRVKIDNSWTPKWGNNGCAVLEGSKAIPDGQACPRVLVTGSTYKIQRAGGFVITA